METAQPVIQHEANYPRRSTRLFLGVAFAALVAILVGTGWSALRTLSEMHAREEGARRDFLSRTEPIVVVRSKLTVYGNLAQDLAAPNSVRYTKNDNVFSQIQTELALLKQGGVIQEVNHSGVANSDEFTSAIGKSKGDSLLLVNRGGNKLYLAVEVERTSKSGKRGEGNILGISR